MQSAELQKLFDRDLNKLKTEIGLYRNEEKIWYKEKAIPNTAGNLCLHLVGNLQHFIGTILGNTGYQRQRELEFSSTGIAQSELMQQVEETLAVVNKTLANLSEEDFKREFPIDVFGYKMTTGYFLIHLAMHLDYHLGQINYHRRLLDDM